MIRALTLRAGFALIVLAVTALPVMAGNDWHFKSTMKGANERPIPVVTNAAGTAIYSINAAETEITYRLIVANIDGVTQSHIHCGTSDVAGPVVVFLYGFNPVGVTQNGILAEGTITAADIIPRPDSVACPGGIATLADLIAKIRNGGAYTNVHTLTYPAGEIRGDVR